MKPGRIGKDSSKNIGNFYEGMAADYLEKQGYRILEKNFRCPKGEIDIIARDEEYLCFIEVKFRSSEENGGPEGAVNRKKQKRLSGAALYYLMQKGYPDTVPCRFDVVGVTPERILLIKNAFSFKG